MKIHLLIIILALYLSGCAKSEELENILIQGNLQSLRQLISEKKLKPNSKLTKYEIPLLSYAVTYQHVEIVAYLLEQGADIDAKTKKGFTVYDSLLSLINQSGPNRENSIKKWMELGKTKEDAEKNFPSIDERGRNFNQEGYEKWLKIKVLLDDYKFLLNEKASNIDDQSRNKKQSVDESGK